MDFAPMFESLMTGLAIIVGGGWVFMKYRTYQEDRSHVEFSADVNFIGKQGGWWIIELIGTIKNVGKVRHTINKFEFDLNGLCSDDQIECCKDWGNQVDFPHEIAKGSFLPSRTSSFFIGPGATSKYSYITRVPKKMTFVIFHCWFKYSGDRGGHTAERTVRVPLTQ